MNSQEWFTTWGNNLIESSRGPASNFHATLDVFSGDLNVWVLGCMKDPEGTEVLVLPELAFNYWYSLATKPKHIMFGASKVGDRIYMHASTDEQLMNRKIKEKQATDYFLIHFILDNLLIVCSKEDSEPRTNLFAVYTDLCKLTKQPSIKETKFNSYVGGLGYGNSKVGGVFCIKHYKLISKDMGKLSTLELADNPMNQRVLGLMD